MTIMTVTPQLRDQILDGWLEPGTALRIAWRLDVRPWRRIYREWRAARVSGELPPLMRPPRGFTPEQRAEVEPIFRAYRQPKAKPKARAA